ncbi:MAG: trypsin-like peptidase domain-containing protein [Candidatus Daviesbacteria bacterium]|nr:trypsin-like peptidase domain-containing protein [Candidatus Daviesbacteria bacterium]
MKNLFKCLIKFFQLLFNIKLVLIVLLFCFIVDFISEAKYFNGFNENNYIVSFIVNYLIWYTVVGLAFPAVRWLKDKGWHYFILVMTSIVFLLVALNLPKSPLILKELTNLAILLSLAGFTALMMKLILNLIKLRPKHIALLIKKFVSLLLETLLAIIKLPLLIRSKHFSKVAIVVLVSGLAVALWQIDQLSNRLGVIENRLGGSSKIACNEKDTIAKVRQSVVRIVGGESEGSGFAIKEGGTIVTNFHVIEFEPSPKVILPDNTFETAEIIMADKNADLAILKINKNLPVLSWGRSELLEQTEELLAIGYPFGGQLLGDPSVNKGILAGTRYSKDNGIQYIQTDTTLNPGVSGGPMVDICGKVMGINTAGTAGLGLAISSKSFKDKQFDMLVSDNPLKDIKKITLEPNKSALDAVNAFYSYLKMRKMQEAFGLLSGNFKKGYDFNYWEKGYSSLLDNTAIKITEDKDTKDRINVKLATKELINEEIIYKYFEGYWDVKKSEDKWQLWEAHIKEVNNPEYSWFYE